MEKTSIKSKKIEQAVIEAQGRARERTIDFRDIVEELQLIEEKLQLRKKDLEGLKVIVDVNAQDFPRAYKYTPYSTHFEAIFHNNQWYILNVFRDVCTTKKYNIKFTEAQEKEILANMRRGAFI